MVGIQFKKAMYLLVFHPALSVNNRRTGQRGGGQEAGGLLNRQNLLTMKKVIC